MDGRCAAIGGMAHIRSEDDYQVLLDIISFHTIYLKPEFIVTCRIKLLY